jgi:hypothetical protein
MILIDFSSCENRSKKQEARSKKKQNGMEAAVKVGNTPMKKARIKLSTFFRQSPLADLSLERDRSPVRDVVL